MADAQVDRQHLGGMQPQCLSNCAIAVAGSDELRDFLLFLVEDRWRHWTAAADIQVDHDLATPGPWLAQATLRIVRGREDLGRAAIAQVRAGATAFQPQLVDELLARQAGPL